MSGVFMHICTAEIYIELCLKWLCLLKKALTFIISQNGYHILFVTSSNGWWHDPTPQKSPVTTLLFWTQLVHNILIRLKQTLLQNTEIWTLRKIKLMKGKALRKHSLHEKTAASVLLKLFISGNEWCHTTDAP